MQTQISRRSRQTRQEQRLGFLLRKAIQLRSIAIQQPIAALSASLAQDRDASRAQGVDIAIDRAEGYTALLGQRLGSSQPPRLQGRQNRKKAACTHRMMIVAIPDTNWQVWPCILCSLRNRWKESVVTRRREGVCTE